jgi:hypothetical protein
MICTDERRKRRFLITLTIIGTTLIAKGIMAAISFAMAAAAAAAVAAMSAITAVVTAAMTMATMVMTTLASYASMATASALMAKVGTIVGMVSRVNDIYGLVTCLHAPSVRCLVENAVGFLAGPVAGKLAKGISMAAKATRFAKAAKYASRGLDALTGTTGDLIGIGYTSATFTPSALPDSVEAYYNHAQAAFAYARQADPATALPAGLQATIEAYSADDLVQVEMAGFNPPIDGDVHEFLHGRSWQLVKETLGADVASGLCWTADVRKKFAIGAREYCKETVYDMQTRQRYGVCGVHYKMTGGINLQSGLLPGFGNTMQRVTIRPSPYWSTLSNPDSSVHTRAWCNNFVEAAVDLLENSAHSFYERFSGSYRTKTWAQVTSGILRPVIFQGFGFGDSPPECMSKRPAPMLSEPRPEKGYYYWPKLGRYAKTSPIL